jgi:hypothetical protein
MLQEPIRVFSESGITCARLVKLGLCKNFSRSREKRRGPRRADSWAHCAFVLPWEATLGPRREKGQISPEISPEKYGFAPQELRTV